MTAAESLRERFLTLASTGRLMGSDNLSELSAMAISVSRDTKGSERILAYVLSYVFSSVSEALNNRPVHLSEANMVKSKLSDPVERAIHLLCKPGSNGQRMLAAENLINVQEELGY